MSEDNPGRITVAVREAVTRHLVDGELVETPDGAPAPSPTVDAPAVDPDASKE